MLRATRRDDRHVAIEVEDHGRGIGADDLPRIFEPFFTTRPDGTGLGLAICHKVVRAPRRRHPRALDRSAGLDVHRHAARAT